MSLATFGVAFAGLAALRRAGAPPAGAAADADDRARRLHGTSLTALAVVSGLYHQAYDALALTLPLVVLWWRPDAAPWRAHPVWRRLALALVAIPFVNYFAADFVVGRLGLGDVGMLVASSVSAAAIVGTLVVYAVLAVRWRGLTTAGRPT